MNDFLDFLRSSRRNDSGYGKQMLAEAKIVSSKNQFWPKFSIDDFLKIAEYSVAWNSKSSLGTLKIKATEDQLTALEKIISFTKGDLSWSSNKDLALTWKKVEKTSQVLCRIQGENGAEFEDQLNDIASKFKKDGCQASYDKVEKPLLTTVEDPNTGKKKKIPDPSGKKILIQTILKAKGPKDKMKELNDTLDKLGIEGANIKLTNYDPSQEVDAEMFGDFQIVAGMAAKLLAIKNGSDPGVPLDPSSLAEVKQYLDKNFEFKQELDPDTKWIVQCAYKSIYNPGNTDDPHFESVDQFCKFLEEKNVSLAIVAFNDLRNKEIKTVANKQEDAKKQFFSSKDVDDNGKPIFDKSELASVLDKVEKEVKSQWKIGKTLLEVPSIKSLFNLVGIEDKQLDKKEQAGDEKKLDIDFVDSLKFNSSDAGQRCAERRMKLFAAAEKRGAKVFKTSSYVAAVCANAGQVAPFCRPKPKVKPGTNEIDPDCNLEDWEGITPENKAKRDDVTGEYDTIRDGIDDGYGHSFDRLTGEHGQPMNGVQFAESSWCVGGAQTGKFSWDYTGNQSAFNNYTEGGKHPMVVFMPVKRGALYLYAKFLKNGSILENILNENEKCDGMAPKSSNPSDSDQQQFCNKFANSDKEFKKLKNYIEKKFYPDFDPDIDEEDPVFDKSSSGGSCAERRMKLFAAAEHYGAKIVKTKSWVAAICTTGAQVHQFGRLKPIVKPGTNEIDPDCNLEDWEGITPENKAKRDDYNNGDRIRDGIDDGYGKSFDRLKQVSGQSSTVKYAESAWCVCGACSNNFKWDSSTCSYFNSYSDSGKNVIVVFMSTKRGAMYMYSCANGNEQFDNESDCIDGSNDGNPSSSKQRSFLAKLKSSDSDFNTLHTKIYNTYFKKTGSGNSDSMTPAQLLEAAKQNGLMKKNGWLTINNHGDAVKYQPIYDRVAGIVVTTSLCDGMFMNVDLSLINTIDFSKNVQTAYEMFRDANVGTLRILNSESVTNIGSMFKSAILENLLQFDTSHVENASSAFSGAKPSKGQSLKLPAFNLKCCRDMTFMFYGTNVQEIVVQNVDNVEKARDAYTLCSKLASYPETKFPKIFDLRQLTTDESDSAAMMFSGCLVLQSKKKRQRLNTNPDFDFDAALKETEEFYARQLEIKKATLVDSRGFFRVKSYEDVERNYEVFYKFPGVVVELEDGSSLFRNKSVNIRILDLHLVKNASGMFQNAGIRQLQDVIGTETIVNADRMFYGCTARVLPDIEFTKLVTCEKMLADCNNLKDLPSITISGSSNIVDKLSFSYLFGDKSCLADMLDAVGGEARILSWIKNQQSTMTALIMKQLEIHKPTNTIVVNSKALANIVVTNWPSIQKSTKADGIYLDMEDASLLFCSFGNKTPSDDSSKLAIPLIDFSKVKTTSRMFEAARVKSFAGFLNFGGVTRADCMFNTCMVYDGAIPEFDTSGVTNASGMFKWCETSQPMKALDFKSVEYAPQMFYQSRVFASQYDIGQLKFPKVVTCNSLFSHAKGIGNDGKLRCSRIDLPNVVDLGNFCGSSSIEGVVEEVNLPKALHIGFIFSSCVNLTEVRSFSAPLAQDCNNIFSSCTNLKKIGVIELPSALMMNLAFQNTPNLENIMVPKFNASGYNFPASRAFEKSKLLPIFGAKMEKWKAISKLFAIMAEDSNVNSMLS